jgi:SAM-dependent methyltransferase
VTYLLDNAQRGADRRMQVLSRLFDERSRRMIAASDIAPGWRCLEVGGGDGGIARWLGEMVGPQGSVLCTDIDPRFIAASGTSLRVERHDIECDPLPASHFHLIHARLVLIHLPARDQVLRKLRDALAPGGWLVIEDFDVVSLLPDPAVNPAEVRFAAADATREYMKRGGAEPRFGRRLHAHFRRLGLECVRAEACLSMFDHAHPGADLLRANFEQLGERLVAEGLITEEQLREDLSRLERDDWSVPSPIMWTVMGRRPSSPQFPEQPGSAEG